MSSDEGNAIVKIEPVIIIENELSMHSSSEDVTKESGINDDYDVNVDNMISKVVSILEMSFLIVGG